MATITYETDSPALSATFGGTDGSVTFGMAFRAAQAVNALAIRMFRGPPTDTGGPSGIHPPPPPTIPPFDLIVSLWDTTDPSAPVAEVKSSGVVAWSQWVEIPLTSPYALVPNRAYYVSYSLKKPADYCYTNNVFLIDGSLGDGGPSNYLLLTYQDGHVPGISPYNGGYETVSGTTVISHYPYENSTAAAYFWVDIRTSDVGTVKTFPMAIADTSTVIHLGFEFQVRVGVAIFDLSHVQNIGFHLTLSLGVHVADTSTVNIGYRVTKSGFGVHAADTSLVHIGFHLTLSLGVHASDLSTVLQIWFEVNRHLGIAIADTSFVLRLAWGIAPQFPVLIHDSSSVVTLGWHTAKVFPMAFQSRSTVTITFGVIAPTRILAGVQIADTSTVLALGFETIKSGFGVNCADISTVLALSFEVFRIVLGVHIADSSFCHIGFTRFIPTHNPVPPYTGQNQPEEIFQPPALEEIERTWEDGPRVVPPYAPVPAPQEAAIDRVVPPPVKRIDVFSAQQIWPL